MATAEPTYPAGLLPGPQPGAGLPDLLVLIPLAACFLKAASLTLAQFWAGGLERAGPRRLRADLRRVAGRGSGQRRPRHCSSPGCWCATSFPASGCSMR